MIPTPGLRPGLRWLLAVSVLFSALALWWPDDGNRAAAPQDTLTVIRDNSSMQTWAKDSDTSTPALPHRLPTVVMSKARFDPFVGVKPPPAPKPEPPAPVVVAPPAPAPRPAPLSYRYLGRMTDPAGRQLVFLAKADAALRVAVGSKLEEGYVVEAIGADGVRLYSPALDARTVIPIPPARGSAAP